MAIRIIKRLQEVKTLYDILPEGTEGGKEFARIVDILLFHEARRVGKKITIFNDAAGDYYGLDSFENDDFVKYLTTGYQLFHEAYRVDTNISTFSDTTGDFYGDEDVIVDKNFKYDTTGYQYKFYPSPLSSKHRKDIENSLVRTAENQRKLKLKKWILVTPQDMLEPSTRKDGGDVTWFESLHSKFELKFVVEHWGHRKLQSFFLNTPTLCLFYYPELVQNGTSRKNTIRDIRIKYNNNLNTLYSKIEFVGMSVYKQEATKGVPMEHIYIPLNAVPETADENKESVNRINPLSFLKPCTRHVVLGDPGSGKSTLLKFLALVGLSRSLQKRYDAEPDNRLPILITLRHYADELKSRRNLALIDYIQECVQAHFNLKSADIDFFEYYMEVGQAILFFDGLDELPNPQFKKQVRDNIRTLITTYPGNTTIVTSRIVGYESDFRFDEKEFVHYRLTNLQLPEMETFVRDWYCARIDNQKERDTNANDLIRILNNEDHVAIRELAQNPLLLTIVALVHRIDAVLPDERIVLYQKCTETLLNTWHTWKYRGAEVKNRGKIEKYNRRRIEAIAFWMHCMGEGTKASQRAIVPYTELKNFLAKHISQTEKHRDMDYEPEDLAEEFIEFVKERAGLIIEVGDCKYSFVHLTFQEYLTASYIKEKNEMEGGKGIWKILKKYSNDSRWHEVIRLLIAGLKSDDTQEYLIGKILTCSSNEKSFIKSRLLGGLYLDGIESSESFKEGIFLNILKSSVMAENNEQLRPLISILRSCLRRDMENESTLYTAFQKLWKTTVNNKEKISLVLIASSLNYTEVKINGMTSGFLNANSRDAALFKFILGKNLEHEVNNILSQEIDLFQKSKSVLSLALEGGNFASTVFQALSVSTEHYVNAKKAFCEQMLLLCDLCGLFLDSNFNGILISMSKESSIYNWALVLNLSQVRTRSRSRTLNMKLARALAQTLVLALDRARASGRTLDRTRLIALDRARALDGTLDYPRNQANTLEAKNNFWQIVLETHSIYSVIIDSLCNIFSLAPRVQWWEMLRARFLPLVPERIALYDEKQWEKVENVFKKGNAGETEIFFGAWQLLFDIWLYVFEFHKSLDDSVFRRLADLTYEIDQPALRIAHCIRDIAYGDESRMDDLVSMVKSKDSKYRKIFEDCYWRPIP